MKMDLLILHSSRDKLIVEEFKTRLLQVGLNVIDEESIYKSISGELLDSYSEQFKNILVNAQTRAVLVIITENSLSSMFLINELFFAIEIAKQRDKIIIPVVTNYDLFLNSQVCDILGNIQALKLNDSSVDSIQHAVNKINDILSLHYKKELLYDKISSLVAIDYSNWAAENICELIDLLCNEINNKVTVLERVALYKEILSAAERLALCEESGYSQKDKKIAHKRLDAINKLKAIMHNDDFKSNNLLLIAIAIRMNYLDLQIRSQIADTISNGDVCGISGDTVKKEYLPNEEHYLKMYDACMQVENISKSNHGVYTDDDVDIILRAKLNSVCDGYEITRKKENGSDMQSDSIKQLYEVAEYMKKSYDLFEKVQGEFLPEFLMCLKTCYERLRKYSEVIGCADIMAQTIERIAEINQQIERVDDAETDNGIVELGMKALLGFTLPGSGNFDVFLSYKHEDFDLAQNIYHYLKSNLLNPFFDKITLPELSKSEYEVAIMNAIEHSKHFIVVLSDLNYLQSHWVSLEMKTFRHEIVEGRKENANFIIVVTDDVFDEIIKTNKLCLPIYYRSYEIFRVSEYRDSIVKYIK